MGRRALTNERPAVLLCHANSEDVGGADYCLIKMATALQEAGVRVVVALAQESGVMPHYHRLDIPVRIEDIRRIRRRNARQVPRDIVATASTVRRVAREVGAVLVHANDLMDFACCIGGKMANAATVLHARMIVPEPGLRRALAGVAMLSADRILAVSEAVRVSAGWPRDRCEVLYDWLDTEAVGHGRNGIDLRKEMGLPSGAWLIGCVGRIEPWKGQHLLLKALPAVLRRVPAAHVVFVGGAVGGKEDYHRRLVSAVRRMGLADKVSFLGPTPDAPGLMAQMDVVAHTSAQPDPLPGVVMEAALAGRVVVAPNSGGVPEELPPSARPFLYRAAAPKELADRLIKARGSRADELGDANRRWVETRFAKSAGVRALLRIYRSLTPVLNPEQGAA